MSTRPKVTRLVLFKHGVAYLERQGPADGEFELSFRRGDMNDILKSLAVGVASGDATVGAVAYEAPADADEELARRNLRLEPGAALPGLLDAVRGRTVEVTVGGQSHRGEVIGIDEVDTGSTGQRRSLVLRTEGGVIALVDLADVRSLSLIEAPSRDDLEYLIERSRAATSGDSRTVRVHVSGSAEDVRVSYIVPAPIWRVSYRLVCEGDSITLLAMGIVHNPVDEDLDDVELTLTTGQPVSFDIDLYHVKLAHRATVEESERAGAPPTAYETAYGSVDDDLMGAPPMGGYGGAAPVPARRMAAPAGRAATVMADSFGADLAGATVGGDRGEHFEYRVSAPISLKRGMAAMVPLLVSRLDSARRERIWRDGTPPAPDIVLTFDNTTAAVLEEGPAVVYDDGSYAGEAMMPFTTRGGDVMLAFAKDLALTCSRSTSVSMVSNRVTLGDEAVIEELRRDQTHTLRAENAGDEAVDVVFELPKVQDTTLRAGDGFAAPFDETASYRRFRLEVPAHGVAEAPVGESRVLLQTVRYANLSVEQLSRWLQKRLLDEATFAELSGVLQRWDAARRMETHAAKLEAERAEAFAEQARITEQLNVLRDAGPEGAVRQRNVSQLVAWQDRAAALDTEIRRTREAADAEQQAAAAELRQIIARRSQFDSPGASETDATRPIS